MGSGPAAVRHLRHRRQRAGRARGAERRGGGPARRGVPLQRHAPRGGCAVHGHQDHLPPLQPQAPGMCPLTSSRHMRRPTRRMPLGSGQQLSQRSQRKNVQVGISVSEVRRVVLAWVGLRVRVQVGLRLGPLPDLLLQCVALAGARPPPHGEPPH